MILQFIRFPDTFLISHLKKNIIGHNKDKKFMKTSTFLEIKEKLGKINKKY
jgi:hypothetical protein